MIEREQPEFDPSKQLEDALRYVYATDRSLWFKDGVIYSCDVSEKELAVNATFSSLGDLAKGVEAWREAHPPHDDGLMHEIDDPDFLEWRARFPNPEDFQTAAQEIVENRENFDDQATLPCGHCGGRYVTAVCCSGANYMMRYPRLILVNELTGQDQTMVLDIPALLASGKLTVRECGFRNVYPSGEFGAEVGYMFELPQSLQAEVRQLGITAEETIVIFGNEPIELSHIVPDARYGSFRLYKQGGIAKESLGYDGKKAVLPSLLEIIDEVQAQVAKDFITPFEKIVNQDGVAVAKALVFRPLRPLTETFEDLLSRVGAVGYTLGYGYFERMGTEERGASFYLLKPDGTKVARLSMAYSLRENLENAWLALQNQAHYHTYGPDGQD